MALGPELFTELPLVSFLLSVELLLESVSLAVVALVGIIRKPAAERRGGRW